MTGIEKGLVERFRKGDVDAFDQLYGMTVDRVYRFAFRLTGSREDAEDVTVETYAAAYRGRENFEQRSSVETWLFRIAVFQGRRVIRGRKAMAASPGSEVCLQSASDMRMVELNELIQALPEGLRTPFLLVKCEGLTYQQTAEVVKKPMGTVQWAVSKASKALREQWFDPTEFKAVEVSEVCRHEL